MTLPPPPPVVYESAHGFGERFFEPNKSICRNNETKLDFGRFPIYSNLQNNLC